MKWLRHNSLRARVFTTLALVLSAIALLSAAGFYFFRVHGPDEAPIVTEWNVDRLRIREVLRTKGDKEAYNELVRQLEDKPLAVQHIGAHIFGDMLYKREGMQAIRVCDSNFLYGCFHSVVMASIRDKGLDSLAELEETCAALPHEYQTPCEHGIGHGILGSFGYDEASVRRSLELCQSLLPGSPFVDGCNGGVFMENIQRLMHDGTLHVVAFHESNKWDSCKYVDDEYKSACAYWQPLWWTISIIPLPEDYVAFSKTLGTWCTEAPGGAEAIQQCIAGIGNVAYSLIGTDATKTASVCAAATTDLKYRYRCHVAAARRLWYSIPHEQALKACNGLYPSTQATCREEVKRATETGAIQ